MRKLFCLFLLACALCASDDLPPVPVAVVRTAAVPLAEVPIPEIVIPGVSLSVVTVPAAALADCGVATPSDRSDRSDRSDKAVVPLTADCGVATPSDRSDKSDPSDRWRPAAVPGVGDNLAAAADYLRAAKLFRDRRSLISDPAAVPSSPVWQAWVKIYSSHTDYTAAHVPLPDGLRMIAEVRLPADRAVMLDNLAFYRKRGYNAALVTFDGSENPGELAELARQCRAAGLAPWFAFGGKEDLRQSVLIPPAVLARIIEELAPLCDGMMLFWRRTSAHLLLPDRPWTDFILRTARASNPRLCIVGESYFGRTAASDGKFAVTTSVPDNASGCLLVNVGYITMTPRVLDTLFGTVKSPKLVLVLGERPYYRTSPDNRRSFAENLAIKEIVETRFRKAGAAGTVTLHGDGSNGLYDRNHTDNLARTGRN